MAPETDSLFPGFEPLTANYLYCPNQFFDVCLPNCSRGSVRIVAYLLRETLGWLDQNGNPLKQEFQVSYRQLIEHAGVSRGAIGPALAEAIKAGFITCSQQGQANASGRAAKSAVYMLRWDQQPDYAKTLSDFRGFYSGEGHRTPVPNRFFDEIIRQESLSVVKVVGSVIRHTIGYQNQFGGRRQEVPLSHQQIARYAKLSKGKTLSAAIQIAVKRGFIEIRQQGQFSHEKQVQQATCYGIRWLQQAEKSNNGSEIPTEAERFKKPSSNGSFLPVEERFKKPSSIKKTNRKDIQKQQTAVVAEYSKTVERLMNEGFQKQTAMKLEQTHGTEVINRQLDWIAARKPEQNKLGMLRKAIEEDWCKPTTIEQRERRESIRKREQLQHESARQDEQNIQQKKRERNLKKQTLLAEWEKASHNERQQWIQKAVEVEASKVIRELLRRQSSKTSKPHIHVLNIVATDRKLPRLF